MKVFLSWSGDTSRQIAEALRDWLPNVLQAVDPWMSKADIEPGTRWGVELAARLEEIRFGVLCLTPQNLTSAWMLFEAGALSKSLTQTFLCPYLYDLAPSALT